MPLFPSISVAGHGANNGLDPDGGALQEVIARNLFKEPGRSNISSRLGYYLRPPIRAPLS